MGKCIHIIHYKVVLRYAISIWKTQLQVQQGFFAPHLPLKQPMWELPDYTVSVCVSTRAPQKNRMLLLEFLSNRHGILQRLFIWRKNYECDKWNPNTVSILPLKCNTLFWPSVRTLWFPRIYAEDFKSNLHNFNRSNEKYLLSFYLFVKNPFTYLWRNKSNCSFNPSLVVWWTPTL